VEVRYTREANGLTTLTVEVDPEQVQETYQKAVRDLRRHVNVPGFRPGRVPPKMVESIVGRDRIVQYAQEMMQEEVYPKALAETPELVTLADPEIKLDKIALGESATMEVKVVTAVVQLGTYKGLAVERWRSDVSDEEARDALETQYQRDAQFTDADHAEAQLGDHVVFSLRIIDDEGTLVEEFPPDDPLRIELGNNSLQPNIDEHLVGLAAGQDAVFEVAYPEDFNNEELAGATREFVVGVSNIQCRETLQAWAQRAGGLADLEAALAMVKETIRVQRAERFRLQAREAAVRAAVEGSTIDLPRSEIEAAVMEEIEEIEEDLTRRGMPADQVEELLDGQQEAIRERVGYDKRREVVLRAIGQAEEIAVERDDLAREVATMATLNRVEPRLMLRRLEEENMLGTVARNARLRKAAELLLAEAEVTEVDPPAEALAEEQPHHHHDHDHDHDEDHDQQPDAHHAQVESEPEDEPRAGEPEDEPCP
jgi:trigger factor